MDGLEPGKYNLELKEEMRNISLNVKQGKAWHDQAYIETSNSICEYQPPLSTMSISNFEGRLKFDKLVG